MISRVLNGPSNEDYHVDDNDPLAMKAGQQVEAHILGWGSDHRDKGKLMKLSTNEVALQNEKGVTVHFPR